MDCLLTADKPAGWTSQDVVSRVRRLFGVRRVGHGGTLDPLATGVLPIGVGQGTRVLEYIGGLGKTYRATVHLGISTDTYDAEGQVVQTSSFAHVTRTEAVQALARFSGWIEQRPPAYSAIKRNGRPLYAYARAGITVETPPRRVRVDRLAIHRFESPELELEIECGSGFYVRSLAHDLGEALGCGAHLSALVRTRVGPFFIETAATITALEAAVAAGNLTDCLWALDTPLQNWPAVIVSEPHCSDLVNGKRLTLPISPPVQAPMRCRAYSCEGELIAVAEIDVNNCLRPLKVFPAGHRGPNLAVSLSDRIIDAS